MAITRRLVWQVFFFFGSVFAKGEEKNFLNSCVRTLCDKYKTAPQNSLLHNRSLPRIVPAAVVLWGDAFAACSSFSAVPRRLAALQKTHCCTLRLYIRELFFFAKSPAALRRRHFVARIVYGPSIWNWVWGRDSQVIELYCTYSNHGVGEPYLNYAMLLTNHSKQFYISDLADIKSQSCYTHFFL